MSATLRALVFGLGLATLAVAAKAHGRQLRLERELRGFFRVTFGGDNPEFVQALWGRERWAFWGLAVLLIVGSVGFRLAATRSGWLLPMAGPAGEASASGALLLHVLLPFTAAFVLTGLFSAARLVLAIRADVGKGIPRPETWFSHATWGSAGWWALTVVLSAALVLSAWRRSA